MEQSQSIGMDGALQGRNIIVTGAGQGIGEAIAVHACRLGARVILVDVNADALEQVAQRLGRDKALTLAGSVTDAAFVDSLVPKSLERFGPVHGLVNNAGISRAAMIEKMTREQWQAVVDVNLTGAFLCLQAVGRHMLGRARAGETSPGAIVNVSSDAGRRGSIGQINYAATKAAVFAMTMSAAREWAKYGIRVNTVTPGGIIDTPMTETIRGEKFIDKYLDNVPLGRVAGAHEIAGPVCFMLSDAASYITGQSLAANGGFHMQLG